MEESQQGALSLDGRRVLVVGSSAGIGRVVGRYLCAEAVQGERLRTLLESSHFGVAGPNSANQNAGCASITRQLGRQQERSPRGPYGSSCRRQLGATDKPGRKVCQAIT